MIQELILLPQEHSEWEQFFVVSRQGSECRD